MVEPLSLDEAFLDVTENKMGIPMDTSIAKEIRQKIYEKTNLTAPAGVYFNRFLAKIASDINKPNGIKVIIPEEADKFIEKLAIGKFFGVGKVTEKRMHELGIYTGKDLKKFEKDRLLGFFGKKTGYFFYDIARGIDNRPVEPYYVRKSIGKEITLEKDIDDIFKIIQTLEELSLYIEKYVQKKNIFGRTITLKIKYFDFKNITRSITVNDNITSGQKMMVYIKNLLNTFLGYASNSLQHGRLEQF